MPHVRKPKLVQQRLEEHASFVATNPVALRGQWRSLRPEASRLHLDLGCGKGLWTTRAARVKPDVLFVGVDREAMCVSFAAERAAIGGVASSGEAAAPESGFTPTHNALFAIGEATEVEEFFAPGEVDVIHLNFPTPFPRKKESHMRVTEGARLMSYRTILGANGLLRLKTDSQPLFDFSLEQLKQAGYEVLWQTRDLHGSAEQPDSLDAIMSGYEERLIAKGACVHTLHARPGTAPESWQPSEPKSLFDYLPEDLESIDYLPLGMEDAITNMRNRRRHENARTRG